MAFLVALASMVIETREFAPPGFQSAIRASRAALHALFLAIEQAVVRRSARSPAVGQE